MDTAGNIKGNWRLILLVLGIVIAFGLLYLFRSVLLPFVCGLVLAYLLYPVISWIEKRLPSQGKWLSARRAFLIVFIFVVLLALIGLLAFYVMSGVVSSFSILLRNAPHYFTQGLETLREWAAGIRQWFPPEMQQHVDQVIGDIGTALGNALRSAFIRGISFIPTTFGFILGFIALPVFLFYILKDWERLSSGIYSAFPSSIARHIRGIVSVIDKVLGRWIRAQLVLSATVAILCFIGLAALGIALAPALAILQGLMEFIPILGPWIGGAIGVLVTLAIAPQKAVWVAVIYLVVQLLENILLVPRIQGSYFRIHPALILVLLPLGAYIAGLWGIVLIVPLTATIIEIYKYVRSVSLEGHQQVAQD